MGMTTTTSSVSRRALTGVALLAMGWGMVQGRTQAVAQGGMYAQADSVFIDTLDVLVLLPFGLQVDTLPGGFLPRKAGRLREIALETLHGLEAASRELAEAGLPMRLHVLDEVPDSLGKLQFNNLDIAKSDLVVGPLMRENVGVAVPRIDRFGREHVLLTEQPERYVERGLAVRQSVASELAATELLADLVATRHDTDHVMLVVTGASDAALEAAFETEFNAVQREKWLTPKDSMRYALLDTIQADARSVGRLADHVSPYERNVVVSVAGRSARSMWAALQTELQMNDSSDFVLFAHPELAEMPFVEGDLMEKWRLTLPLANQIQWQDSMRWDALEDFRLRMATEPQKYAVLAHDALLDAGLRRHPWLEVKPWAEPMVWEASEASGAWSNVSWSIKRFEDLQWMPLDSFGPVPPFVPRMFYTEGDTLIPVPEKYQHLFPEEYPDALAPNKHP